MWPRWPCASHPTSSRLSAGLSSASWVVRPLKAKELAELSDEELDKKFQDLKTELFNLRFQNVTGQLDSPARLGEVRRDIARVKTVQRMRQIAAERGASR